MIQKLLFGDIDKFNIGDEVEFEIKSVIIMNGSAWMQDPQYQQIVYGNFKKPGERYKIRGKVTAISNQIIPLVHVEYENIMPGFEWPSWFSKGSNNFCCSPRKLRKINE